MLHSVFITLGANVNLWGLLRCRGGGCALHFVQQVFQHRFRGVFAHNQRHLSKCFLPHGHDLGTVFYLLASLQPQPLGKVPGEFLGKRLSSRRSPQPPLSKTLRQGEEAVGAASALSPQSDVRLSVRTGLPREWGRNALAKPRGAGQSCAGAPYLPCSLSGFWHELEMQLKGVRSKGPP